MLFVWLFVCLSAVCRCCISFAYVSVCLCASVGVCIGLRVSLFCCVVVCVFARLRGCVYVCVCVCICGCTPTARITHTVACVCNRGVAHLLYSVCATVPRTSSGKNRNS